MWMLLIFFNTHALHANISCTVDKNSHANTAFSAGSATANITPSLGAGIVGGWGTPPASYIHDELHARCLVLDDGTAKLVFIVVDVVGINQALADEVKRLVQEGTGISPENVLISAVHNHSAASVEGMGDERRKWDGGREFDNYQKFVITRLTDVVKIALVNLEPAQIGWGVGNVPEHVFVRRWKMKSGTTVYNPFGEQDKVKMNPGHNNPNLLEPASEPDSEVSFISVRSTAGRPIALLANYSLHYVGGVPKGHISGDYFAVFADRIQELLEADRQEPSFVGIMTNGTSGDVNNINYGAPRIKKDPYVQIKLVAEDVAREVFRVHNAIAYKDWVRLGAVQRDITLKVRKPNQAMIDRAKKVLDRPDDVKMDYPHEKTYAKRLLYHMEWPDQIDIPLQTFRIGDLGIAAIPFEVFAETGLEIKAKSPFKKSITIELANGSYGYLPTPEQHKLGGYETWLPTNRVEKEASRKIVKNLLEMFEELKGGGTTFPVYSEHQ